MSSEQTSAKVAFPLRTKLVLLAIVLGVLPVVGVGVALVDVNADTVATANRELQISAAQDISQSVEHSFEGADRSLRAVGRTLADPSLADDAKIATAASLVEASDAIDHAAIYDATGKLIDVLRQGDVEVTVPDQLAPELVARAAEQDAATGEPTAGPRAPRVMEAVPITANDKVTGFVAAWVSLDPLQDRVELLANTHFADIPDALWVIDQQLRILADPDGVRGAALESAKGQGIVADVDPATLRADVSRSGEFAGADGQVMVGTLVSLQGRPWTVVAQVPGAVAYASLEKMRTIVVGTVVGVAALALLIGLFVAGRITSPLKRLRELAGALASRDFSRRVQVNTRDELNVLGHAMNRAAEDLEASEATIAKEIAIRSDLGRYLAKEVVDKVIAREQDMGLGGERREVTIMFADLVAFTPLTEKLAPEDVVKVLNELFTICTEIIFRHGGVVDKFLGDCVMAMWGAPAVQPDHAARSLAAAEEIMAWLEIGNANWRKRYGINVQLAIGINSGEAIVGNIGSESRMEYTAIGDAVNVAARLEAIARPQQILISKTTRDAAGAGFDYAPFGKKIVAGRDEEVELYEVRS